MPQESFDNQELSQQELQQIRRDILSRIMRTVNNGDEIEKDKKILGRVMNQEVEILIEKISTDNFRIIRVVPQI